VTKQKLRIKWCWYCKRRGAAICAYGHCVFTV